MRRLGFAIALITVFAATAAMALSGDELAYVVECRWVVKNAAGKETALTAPRIKLFDGQTGTIKDLTQTPFAIAAKSGGEARVAVLEEGLDVELTVHHDRDGFATLDATIQKSQITSVKSKRERQAVRHEKRIVRVIECLSLDEELTVELEGPGEKQVVQLAVYLPGEKRHWEESTPSQTPPDIDLRYSR